MPAGYSGTPLPKKLGIKDEHRVGLSGAPPELTKTLGRLPPGVELTPASRDCNIILAFVRDQASLAKKISTLKAVMKPTTALWLCWPKKTSPLAKDLTGDGVRAAGLRAGLVDIKVCAIDDDWSGLKFVYRLKDRPTRKK